MSIKADKLTTGRAIRVVATSPGSDGSTAVVDLGGHGIVAGSVLKVRSSAGNNEAERAVSEIINVNRSATRAQTLRLVQMASIERPSTTARPSAALAIDTSFGQSAMFIRVASNRSAGSTIILSRDRNEDPSDSPSTSLLKKDAVGTISMEAFTSTERAKIAVVEGAMGPSKTPGLRDMPGTLEFKTSQVNRSTVHTRLFLSDDHMLSVGDDHKFTVKTINGSRLLLFSQDSKGASDAGGGSINVGSETMSGVYLTQCVDISSNAGQQIFPSDTKSGIKAVVVTGDAAISEEFLTYTDTSCSTPSLTWKQGRTDFTVGSASGSNYAVTYKVSTIKIKPSTDVAKSYMDAFATSTGSSWTFTVGSETTVTDSGDTKYNLVSVTSTTVQTGNSSDNATPTSTDDGSMPMTKACQ